MATDYTDPARDWTVNGRSVMRAIEVLGLFGDGASPAGAAQVLLKEAGAVEAHQAVRLPGRPAILEALRGVQEENCGYPASTQEFAKDIATRLEAAQLRAGKLVDVGEPPGIRLGREAALSAISRVLRGLASGTVITDEAVAEQVLAALECAGAVEAHSDAEHAGLPRPRDLERALRTVSDLHTAPDARRDSVTFGTAISPYTLAREILHALREQDAGRSEPPKVDHGDEGAPGFAWCGDVNASGHACTTYAGHGGWHSDDDGHEWPNAAPRKTDDGTDCPGDTTWIAEAEALRQVAGILTGLNGAAGERVIAHAAEMLGGATEFD